MKRKGILALLCFATALFQSSFASYMAAASIRPNFVVILTASFALMCGKGTGMAMGFATGLMLDLFSGGTVGFYAMIYTWIGFLAGYAYRIFYDDDIKTPLLLIAGADFLYGIYQYVGTFLLRGRIHFGFYLGRIIIPEVLYTVIMAVFVYQLNFWINRKTTQSYF